MAGGLNWLKVDSVAGFRCQGVKCSALRMFHVCVVRVCRNNSDAEDQGRAVGTAATGPVLQGGGGGSALWGRLAST
jgi:hypothetical protein